MSIYKWYVPNTPGGKERNAGSSLADEVDKNGLVVYHKHPQQAYSRDSSGLEHGFWQRLWHGDVRNVLKYPHPALISKSEPVNIREWTADSRRGRQIRKDLAVLIASAKTHTGITGLFEGTFLSGLAAPQVGINLRMFVISLKHPILQNETSFYIAVNPEIVDYPDRSFLGNVRRSTAIESCGSLSSFYVKAVTRPETIAVRYQTPMDDGSLVTVLRTMYGYESRVFQHELDHLDGILINSK